jgi:hypothetical protein
MSNFATGKKAKAISDRSGLAFPYTEMLKEWNGSLVHISTITVTEIGHGRSSSDTVRFRGAVSFDGITADNINLAAGYSITVVDADTYTFSVSTDTATTGSISGGGFRAYAGPVTLVA